MDAASPAREPGRPAQRATFVDGLVRHVLREGVSSLSLRPLAAALGTSDRMLLYYFGSRERLLVTVLETVGAQLQAGLAGALPPDPVPPGQLLAHVWSALAPPQVEPHLRLYVEISGLAARGRQPFAGAAAQVAGQWLDWVESRLAVPAERRREAAVGVLTVVDGLLLMRFVVGEDEAAAAAGWLTDALQER